MYNIISMRYRISSFIYFEVIGICFHLIFIKILQAFALTIFNKSKDIYYKNFVSLSMRSHFEFV